MRTEWHQMQWRHLMRGSILVTSAAYGHFLTILFYSCMEEGQMFNWSLYLPGSSVTIKSNPQLPEQ